MTMAMPLAIVIPIPAPSHVGTAPRVEASVAVASMVLSPNSATMKARLTPSSTDPLRSVVSSSSSSSPSHSVQMPNPRNRRPAPIAIARSGSAAPSAAPATADSPSMVKAATAIPASTGAGR
jgi:hypothetical protein